MNRFDSLVHSRDDTRRILRDRLGRMLRPANEPQGPARNVVCPVSDIELLDLLSRVHITYDDDVDTVRAAYARHIEAHPGSPIFDDLIEAGWFAVTWGRVVTDLRTRDAARQQAEPLRAAIQMVLDTRHIPTLTFGDVSDLSGAAQTLVAELAKRPNNFRLPARSPEWIAARLWERRPEVSDTDALRWWVDRWQLLGAEPLGAPTTWWDESAARSWRQAAIDLLRVDVGLVAWDREKLLVDAWLHHQRSRTPSPPVPTTLIDRYLWLNDLHGDHWRRALVLCGDTWVLMAMLCRDLVAHDPALQGPSAEELLDLVVGRPTLLVLLATRIRQHPTLLVDLLLHRGTCALACLMIADWNTQPISACERTLQMTEQAEARERAVADALAVAVAHLRAGGGSVEELAALLVWVHGQVRTDEREPWDRKIRAGVLNTVRRAMQTLSPPKLEEVLSVLSISDLHGLGTPRFTAALDVVTFAALTDVVDPEELVEAYVSSYRGKQVRYNVALTSAHAASLAVAARRSTAWSTFLAPVDVRARVAMATDAESSYIVRDDTARALRAHIRVLSRAITGWEGVPPVDLLEALAAAIRAGSSDHTERGRVAAFAAQYEVGPPESRNEPPLLDDVIDACVCIPSAARNSLQAALSLIDEPLALARVLQRAPSWMRDSLRSQIEALTYNEASEIQSLTEMAGRIDALLAAKLPTAAAKHLEVELGLTTLGRVRGREVARLRWKLRLALLQGDFLRIAQTTVPDGLTLSEVEPAQDVIAFFKGLAELSNANGSASTAVMLFSELSARNPGNAAYVVNLFAARVSKLLGANMFARLASGEIADALEALNAAESGLECAFRVGEEDRKSHRSNKALLLLALGRPSDAYDVLQSGPVHWQDDTHAAYAAVACARTGRVDDAYAALAAGNAVHPDSAVLMAARQHLVAGRPGHFRVLSVANDDSVVTIQGALLQLTHIDPSTQARVASRESVEALVTKEVRCAAAAVTASAPTMRTGLYEDDVTTFLQHVLQARVGMFGWTVSDGRGGYSAIGNPGIRDLVLRKDGYALAIIEAMVCRSNPATETTRSDLTGHFQKLFGYDECTVFYHVVYAYLEEPHKVIEVMREIATSSAPPAFTFLYMHDLPREDSRPRGFVATYQTQGEAEAKVVCLTLDMRQHAQREAAALAGHTRRRRRPKP